MFGQLRERSLCLLNSEHLDPAFQPWLTNVDVQFHPDVCALYSSTKVNPIQSIQSDYLPPFISYLWPLAHDGNNVWGVDHSNMKDPTVTTKFVMKYDLLVWNLFCRSTPVSRPSTTEIIYPKVIILAPDWCTCESTYQHLTSANTDVLKEMRVSCLYEGCNIEGELYRQVLTDGCDLLIATPTIIQDLIQKRFIHFEQLQLIVYDQLDLLLQAADAIYELFNHLHLQANKSKALQHVLLSRLVDQTSKDFVAEHLSTPSPCLFLSSSMLETYTYQDYFVYCEPCRNWCERKQIIKDTLDLASHCQKKVVMCAYQTRRLATMQSILNDLSIQSILIHSQLSAEEIGQYVHEWQSISDRPVILMIQDEILHDIPIGNTDIIIHLDVQRLLWYQLYHQRLKLMFKHLSRNERVSGPNKVNFTSLKSIENFYQANTTSHIPLVVLLWPGDCAQVTYDLIDYLNHSRSFVHPLIERLARNNCHESVLAKLNVQFCPTLKTFGQCLSEKKLKRCPYRHQFHPDVDSIAVKEEEQSSDSLESSLSKSFELCLPDQGEVELRITHVSDGNRLWAHALRARTDINQTLTKIFDYDRFKHDVEQGFEQVKHRPLSEIVPGDIYFYRDSMKAVHRVYVYEHEQTYFDLRRADAILNRLSKVSNTVNVEEKNIDEVKQTPMVIENDSTPPNDDRSPLTVFSLDTGMTFTLKPNEHLFPIEPSSLKQYPPLATEIILCNIQPVDKITMTFTRFTIETLRSLTLNETYMGRIKLATRWCLWIDPLVKPVRLTALKRIAYEKPVRKQLMLAKLVDSNDSHMLMLERLAVEAQLKEPIVTIKEEPKELVAPTKEEPATPNTSTEEESSKESTPMFKPFLNRSGQLIINPLGRSKEFFSRHHQPSHGDFVQTISSSMSFDDEHSLPSNEADSKEQPANQLHQCRALGRGHRLRDPQASFAAPTLVDRPQSIPVMNAALFDQSPDYSTLPPLVITEQSTSSHSNMTTPSEVGPSKMAEIKIKTEHIDEEKQETLQGSGETNSHVPSEEKPVVTENTDENDQMMFIFGPKLFSQFRQIKDMEDEQRRQADFPVQRNRHRHPRFNNNNNNNNKTQQADGNEDADGDGTEVVRPPNMSRYEPFVGERSSLTQEQIDYKQTQRKTRLFWEQTSRDIYLTIGFYNVDSTQTRVEFGINSIYCRTRIRTYDRYVRIHLASDIVPERCSFQVRRSNILVTLRKAKEGVTWTTLSERAIEPRPEFFNVAYGSDDESDTEKRRRTVNRQWQQIREEKSQSKVNQKEESFVVDEIEDDEHPGQAGKLHKAGENDEENNQQELTDTSSDCHSTDSDDCYYEDQVPANHIPRGYDEADYDHRFYSHPMRT